MEETNTPAPVEVPQKKLNNKIIALIACILLALGGISFGIVMMIAGQNNSGNQGDSGQNDEDDFPRGEVVDFGTYRIEKYQDEPYYIFQKDFEGTYDIQSVSFVHEKDDGSIETTPNYAEFKVSKVVNYEDYEDYCKKWGLEQTFTTDKHSYAIFSNYIPGSPNAMGKLAEAKEEDDSVWLYYYEDSYTGTSSITGYAIIVPVSYSTKKIVPVPLYSELEFKKIKDPSHWDMTVKKPILYLYPEDETEVSVLLGKADNLTVSYPRYEGGWNVLAKPNGELKDLKTGRELYALYYESKLDTEYTVQDEGFVVKGADAAAFLEEKLSLLGLSAREAEEFIVYWLSELEANAYNYVHFESLEEINENMPLTVSPTPDSVIRVWMTYKGLESPIEVREQKIETPSRSGFTIVEWGGSELR